MSFTFKKGDYEKAVEHVKVLLDSNMGISDILTKTNLSEDQVKNIIKNRQAEFNDKKNNLH